MCCQDYCGEDYRWELKPPTDYLLPEDFRVFSLEDIPVSHPFGDKILPTFNDYKGPNGGYVAIYTNQREGSVYSVGGGFYVLGQIRVPGSYVGRIFVPDGYRLGDNITRDSELLKLCHKYLPDWTGDMWVGGDTGGWYGL